MAFDEQLRRAAEAVRCARIRAGHPQPVESAPRPFDPDELPLEIDQTEEERAFAAKLPARAFAPVAPTSGPEPSGRRAAERPTTAATSTHAEGRSLSLRRITRFRGGRTSV